MSHYLFHISWLEFILIIIFIVLFYIVLKLILNAPWIKPNLTANNFFFRFLQHLFWPLTGVVIAGLLVMKNPIAYGFMVLITALLSWRYVKEIFLGAFIKFNQVYNKNTPYNINGKQGTLMTLDLIGGKFKFHKGTQFFTYSQLLDSQAIALVNDIASDDLTFRCQNNGSENFTVAHIQDILFLCPYVDHYYRPKINIVDSDIISIKISARSQISPDKILGYFSEKAPLINFKISNNTF